MRTHRTLAAKRHDESFVSLQMAMQHLAEAFESHRAANFHEAIADGDLDRARALQTTTAPSENRAA